MIRPLFFCIVIITTCFSAEAPETAAPSVHDENAPRLAAATLTYGNRHSADCFSSAFLRLIKEKTGGKAPKQLTETALSDKAALFAQPFCLLSGQGYFRFTDAERVNLREYLLHGGFLLASAGCSSPAWDASFRDELNETFGARMLTPLPESHPVFHFLFDCTPLVLQKGQKEAQLYGLFLDETLVLIYSPEGLNDTASIPDCCCCTGNEIKNSAQLNANILLYALLGRSW